MSARFRVARNTDLESRLPYLVWLPIEGGLVLKAREAWPRAARVFCSHEAVTWDESGGLVDEAEILLCRRRGAAIDLVLDRPQHARSQFVFTNARGRPAVWWQTQKTAQSANPGARVPRGRSTGPLVVAVDNREKYGWKFAGRQLTIAEPCPLATMAHSSAMLSSRSLSGRPSRIWPRRFPTEAWPSSCSVWPRSAARQSWSKATTRISFELSQVVDPGWPTCSVVSLCATRRFRSYSPVHGDSLKSGLADSSEQLSPTASNPPSVDPAKNQTH